jgi:hypothetical protein
MQEAVHHRHGLGVDLFNLLRHEANVCRTVPTLIPEAIDCQAVIEPADRFDVFFRPSVLRA